MLEISNVHYYRGACEGLRRASVKPKRKALRKALRNALRKALRSLPQAIYDSLRETLVKLSGKGHWRLHLQPPSAPRCTEGAKEPN